MGLPNSMVKILPESMDLPDIFYSMKTYNYYGKSKSILLSIKIQTCNFHSHFNFNHFKYFPVILNMSDSEIPN